METLNIRTTLILIKRKTISLTDMDGMFEIFNPLFASTGLWDKYCMDYRLADKHDTKCGEGWANSLFHYFVYDDDDVAAFYEWIDMLIDKVDPELTWEY